MTRIPGYLAWRETNGKEPINVTPNGGPGTELAKLLRWFGISKGCNCKHYAAWMDRHGADWCEANLETVVGWLHTSAKQRGLPFVAFVARGMVRLAIRRARAAQQSQADASLSAGQDAATP